MLLALSSLLAAADPVPVAAPVLAPVTAQLVTDADLLPALSPAGRADLATRRPDTRWRIAARVDEAAGTVTGEATLEWRNDGPTAVPDLALQLLGNGEPFNGAAMEISEVHVAGRPVTGKPLAGGAYLLLPLPVPLTSGDSLTLTCRFTATPSTAGGMHGLLSRSPDAWCLYDWYPEVALRRAGSWATEPVQREIDPTRTTTAHLLIDLDVPADLSVVAGGTVVRQDDEAGAAAAGRRSRLRIAAPYTRNLVVVLARGLKSQTREVGGVTVRSWHRPGLELGALRTLDACAGSIALFSERFGPYPFSEFEVVAAPLGGDVGGMESTGLVLADERPYEAVRWMDKDAGPGVLPIFMLMVAAAHETGHQWWYSAVGDDPYHDPWLDESLTNWSGNFWMEQAGGEGAGGLAFGMCLTEAHNSPPTARMTSPGPTYPSHEAYGAVVYARGALFYQWLRRKMGEDRFFAFLRAWYEERRWTVATPADWHATLARFATPELLGEADSRWLAGRGLTLTVMSEGAKPVPKAK